MTERNKINVIYEDLTALYVPNVYGNETVKSSQWEMNHWWAEVRCLEGTFFPSGKFLHAVRDTKMTFGQASNKCEQLGLTSILPETAAENTILNEYLSGKGFYLRESLAVAYPCSLCACCPSTKHI